MNEVNPTTNRPAAEPTRFLNPKSMNVLTKIAQVALSGLLTVGIATAITFTISATLVFSLSGIGTIAALAILVMTATFFLLQNKKTNLDHHKKANLDHLNHPTSTTKDSSSKDSSLKEIASTDKDSSSKDFSPKKITSTDVDQVRAGYKSGDKTALALATILEGRIAYLEWHNNDAEDSPPLTKSLTGSSYSVNPKITNRLEIRRLNKELANLEKLLDM